MNYRRQPFQFTTIDPAKRQAELQKRFGFPSNSSDMYVDSVLPGIMGAAFKEPTSSGSSPRLQHRVPTFNSHHDKIDQNIDSGHKPKVRVIPIQVEGVDAPVKRHRTFSGPASVVREEPNLAPEELKQPQFSNNMPSLFNVSEPLKTSGQPRVCNIPIQIENKPEKKVEIKSKLDKKIEKKPERIVEIKEKPSSSKPIKIDLSQVKSNGCVSSKEAVKPKEPEKPKEPDQSVSLKQIEDVLTRLNDYKKEVEEFSGTSKDKKYRYLDEMLTRCMLDLDNVDTLGMDNIRQSRKAAVRQVQQCIDFLDTKINSPTSNSESVNLSKDAAEITEPVFMEVSEPIVQEINEAADSEDKTVGELSNVTESATMEINQPVVEENSDCKLNFEDKPNSETTVKDVSNEMSDSTILVNSNPIIQEAGEETELVIQESFDKHSSPIIKEIGEDISEEPVDQVSEIEISEVMQDLESSDHSSKDVEMEQKPAVDLCLASESIEEMEIADCSQFDQETEVPQTGLEPIVTEPSEIAESTSPNQMESDTAVEIIDSISNLASDEINSVDCELNNSTDKLDCC